jgi:hypothetical protein
MWTIRKLVHSARHSYWSSEADHPANALDERPMKASTAISEERKSLDGYHAAFGHGFSQHVPSAPVEVLICEDDPRVISANPAAGAIPHQR